MARRVWFKPDHQSFGAFILSDQMRDVTFEVAQDIALAARATAKRDRTYNPRRPISHADRYKAKRGSGTIRVHRARRVMATVENDDVVAVMNEFGNKKTRRRRTLAQAGAAFGDFKGRDSFL